MRKCIVLSDSFKGSLSSEEIGRSVKEECRRQFPACHVFAFSVADGGEGTAECFEQAVGAKRVPLTVSGPFGEPVHTFYVRKEDTAVIETAKAAGLPMAEGRLDPMTATTYGVGEMMRHAVEHGCKELVLGLGGSATNDAGCGMAAAMGVRFYDKNGKSFIPSGGTLCDIQSVDLTAARTMLSSCRVRAMCDITNPLFGENGAAYVFAPQKGADAKTVRLLAAGLIHFADVIESACGRDVEKLSGAGAAGGMGAGISAFFGGDLNPGIEIVLDLIQFEKIAEDADLVITGEGKLDMQSLGGKVVVGVAKRAQHLNVPVAALVGDFNQNALEAVYEAGVTAVFGVNQRIVTLDEARRSAVYALRTTCRNLFAYTKAMEKRG